MEPDDAGGVERLDGSWAVGGAGDDRTHRCKLRTRPRPSAKRAGLLQVYRNDQRHGRFAGTFTPHGTSRVGAYANGKHEGRWEYSDLQGHKKLVGTFVDGQRHGKWRHYDTSGRLLGTDKFEHGTGTMTSWDRGRRSAEVAYRHGKKHGPSTTWTADGWVLQVEHFANDRRDGTSISYDAKNVPRFLQTFKDGARHGRYVEWHMDTGHPKKVEGEYVDGLKHGVWTHWDFRGHLLGSNDWDHGAGQDITEWHGMFGYSVGSYRRGKKHGIWRSFDRHGKLEQKVLMADGEGVDLEASRVPADVMSKRRLSCPVGTSGHYAPPINGPRKTWSEMGALVKVEECLP